MAENQWDARGYAQNARFVSDLGMPVVEWLSPQPGEQILDLGCGDGALTAKLAQIGAHVYGIDHSESMVQATALLGLNVSQADMHAFQLNRQCGPALDSRHPCSHFTSPPAPQATRTLRRRIRWLRQCGCDRYSRASRTANRRGCPRFLSLVFPHTSRLPFHPRPAWLRNHSHRTDSPPHTPSYWNAPLA
jgi:SAM-dependent methyltransferase